MNPQKYKTVQRNRRKIRIRKGVYGTADKPRLSVTRSLQNIYAQIIDDEKGITICSASTRGKDLAGSIKFGGNIEAAKIVGKSVAEKAKAAGIEAICFDRNGYKYHGRIKALADAVREGGLSF